MEEKDYEALIHKFANRWCGVLVDSGIDYDDLVQEGWVAYARAIKNFSRQKGVKFVTYLYRILDNHYKDVYGRYVKGISKRCYCEYDESNSRLEVGGDEVGYEEESMMGLLSLMEILGSLSDKAKQIALLIVRDGIFDNCKDVIQIMRKWRELEKEFGDLSGVRRELQEAILGW